MTSTLLHLADFVLLKVIAEAETPPTRRQLWQPKGGGLWNAALKPYVRRGKCTLVTGYPRYTNAITMLRQAELIEQEPPYKVTMKGEFLLMTTQNFPLVVPVEDKSIIWEQAEY